MAGRMQARRERALKTRLDELNQAKKQLDDYVDQLNRLGSSWIRSHGEERGYEDISTQLENSIDILFEALDKMVETTTSDSSTLQTKAGSPVVPGTTLETTTSDSSTLQAKAGSPVVPGTTLEEMLNRMDGFEKKGIALHSQVGQMEEAVKSLVHEKNESKRSFAQFEMQMANSETRHDKAEKQLIRSEERLQQLEKWRQEDRKEMDELRAELGKMSLSPDGGAVGAGPVGATDQGQGFSASLPVNCPPVQLSPGQTLTCWSNVQYNPGGQFEVSSGTYTVPVSGRYRVCLSHTQCPEDVGGFIGLSVMCQPGAGRGEERSVECQTLTWGRRWEGRQGEQLQASQEVEVELTVGDGVVGVVREWCRPGPLARLTAPSGFSCHLLD